MATIPMCLQSKFHVVRSALQYSACRILYVTVPLLLCFTLNLLKAISKYKPPGAYISEGRFNGELFCITSFRGLEGLIHGGVYFRNFTVCKDLYSKESKSLTSFE